jgi:hypothetical protein
LVAPDVLVEFSGHALEHPDAPGVAVPEPSQYDPAIHVLWVIPSKYFPDWHDSE